MAAVLLGSSLNHHARPLLPKQSLLDASLKLEGQPLDVWQMLEDRRYVGPCTRYVFENFLHARGAFAWQVLHLSLCAYHAVFPPVPEGSIFEEQQVRLFFGLFTVLCIPWLCVVVLPGRLMQDHVVKVAVYKSSNSKGFAGGDMFDKPWTTQLLFVGPFVVALCTLVLLFLEPEPLVLLNAMTLCGVPTLTNSYMFFFRLVEHISDELIEEVRSEIELCVAGGEHCWRSVTRMHLKMDESLQFLWKTAMPVYASFFSVIGVAEQILALLLLRHIQRHETFGAAIISLLMCRLCYDGIMRLKGIADITDSCMSKSSRTGDDRQSIYREALQKCGDKMTPGEADEHHHFLSYLAWNPVGVKLGVMIDSTFILKVVHPLVVTFSILWSFLLSTLKM